MEKNAREKKIESRILQNQRFLLGALKGNHIATSFTVDDSQRQRHYKKEWQKWHGAFELIQVVPEHLLPKFANRYAFTKRDIRFAREVLKKVGKSVRSHPQNSKAPAHEYVNQMEFDGTTYEFTDMEACSNWMLVVSIRKKSEPDSKARRLLFVSHGCDHKEQVTGIGLFDDIFKFCEMLDFMTFNAERNEKEEKRKITKWSKQHCKLVRKALLNGDKVVCD